MASDFGRVINTRAERKQNDSHEFGMAIVAAVTASLRLITIARGFSPGELRP